MQQQITALMYSVAQQNIPPILPPGTLMRVQ